MMRSLYSAVSGLKTHQTRMDVIGNNIANVNTEAFKSSNVTFSEIMYQTTASASAGNGATGIGGVNAKQIGLGVATGATQMSIETAGAAETTGNPFDLKLTDSQTTNFFVVSDGNSNMFTRAGSFYVDGNGYLCMTSTGYTLMGWQVDPTTNDIKKDTVTSLQVMSATNQTSSPEATEKAYISGVLDKNDSNLASEEGYAVNMLFYDDLGYSYTAKFYIQPADTDNGEYTIRLADILDQNSSSIFGEGKQYSDLVKRNLFGNTSTTLINEDAGNKLNTITDPNDATQYQSLKVGTIVYNTADEQYYAITTTTEAVKNEVALGGVTSTDTITYTEGGVTKNATIADMFKIGGTPLSIGNLDKTTATVKVTSAVAPAVGGNINHPATTVGSGADTIGVVNGGVETVYTYDTGKGAFVNGDDTFSVLTALGVDPTTLNDGSKLVNGLYVTDTYSYDAATHQFIHTEVKTLPNQNDETALAAQSFFFDTTSQLYYYVESATVKSAVVADMKELDSKGNGYFSYIEDGVTKNVSVASAFGYKASDDTMVEIKGEIAEGAIMKTNFNMNFDTADGTFDYIVTEGQTFANLQTSLLGDNFSNIQIDFKNLLNYNNGKTSTVKMVRGDTTGDGAGKKLGALTGLTVDNAGKVYGTYDNGNTVLLCQIAVAQFANASGLEKVGQNCYKTTLNSGEFDGIGVEVDADGSSINTGQLEMSNVDLSAEFTSMIVTQRGFQANSRVITTSDTLLEELINLKR